MFPSLFQMFWDRSKRTNYNWQDLYPPDPQFLINSLTKSNYLSIFSLLFSFCDPIKQQNSIDDKFSFLLIMTQTGTLTGIR